MVSWALDFKDYWYEEDRDQTPIKCLGISNNFFMVSIGNFPMVKSFGIFVQSALMNLITLQLQNIILQENIWESNILVINVIKYVIHIQLSDYTKERYMEMFQAKLEKTNHSWKLKKQPKMVSLGICVKIVNTEIRRRSL